MKYTSKTRSKTGYNFGVRPYYDINVIRAEPAGLELLGIAKICLLEFAVFAPIFLLVLVAKQWTRKRTAPAGAAGGPNR